ncbi:hypothetical protein SERLA73DRAFT_183077, partial [Serpula lacrymans var. lacrymans S7.3]
MEFKNVVSGLSLWLQISYSLNFFTVIFSILYSTSGNFLATCTAIIEPLEAQVHISYRLHPVSNDS